ncbi:MAG: TonB-dependent receptor [Bacteroidales bacterium]|nr:TonB-dependent receptor [Bacteroidales bacterium]
MKSIFSVSRKALMALTAVVALLFVGGSAFAQSTIRGKVLDSNGEGIIGASVVVPGTTTGVITDIDGNFEIRVAPGTTLEVSCIGYVTQRVTAAANMSVTLQDDSLMLEEAVAVGYGTMKKSDVTGAMVSVGSEELTQRPTNNVFEALQGRAAGVDIRSNERPGEVGAIYIRGQRSINASSTPLYVVDGIPLQTGSLDALNPQDIESIEILKDASATAIYGSRGANGVILVTTKKGAKGDLKVNYSGSFTYEVIKDKATWMTAGEYIDWRRAARYNSDPSTYPSPDAPTYANDFSIFFGGADAYAWRNIERGWDSTHSNWDGSKVQTTDWMALILKPAITHEHTVSLAGGSDKFQSYASVGYLSNKGTIHGQDFQRFTVKTSNDFQPYKWLSAGANINATYNIQNYGLSGMGNFQGGSQSSAYGVATQGYPYAVPFDDEGKRIEFPGGDDRVKNVYGEWDLQTDIRKGLRLIGSLYTQLNFGEMWKPLQGLSLRVNFGPELQYYDRGVFVAKESFNRAGSNYAYNQKYQRFSWTLDEILSYNRDFGKHSVGLTLLHSADSYDYRAMMMDAEKIPLESALWNDFGSVSSLRSYGTDLTQKQMESYMARINYSYAGKYLLTASVRRDGASVLAQGHKWATFPSVALGWRIDQEGFMQGVSWINQLKLRAGWGITGNAAIDPYQTKGAIAALYYPFGSATPAQGYTLQDSMLFSSDDRNIAMANQSLGWEKTMQYNAGLDFNFLNGRISGVFDIYKSYTNDLLLRQSLPALLGYTTTYNNIGKTENFGYDITLNLVPIRTKDWEWTIDINAAYTKNVITELSNGKEDDINNNWFIGESLGSVYTFKSAGIWQESDAAEMAKFNANGNHFEAGMARPVDLSGPNGTPDYKIDDYDKVVIGCTMPRWTFGFNTGVSYKSWALDMQLYGRFKFLSGSDAPWVGGRYNVRKYDYWTPNNTDAKYTKPIFSEAGADSYYQTVDNWMDRSYLKLRNISLSYTFPSKMLNGTGINALKLYVQARNLGSIFNGSEVRDMDTGNTYYNRGFTFGVNISF